MMRGDTKYFHNYQRVMKIEWFSSSSSAARLASFEQRLGRMRAQVRCLLLLVARRGGGVHVGFRKIIQPLV